VESFCPLVRGLPPGERPSEWANDELDDANSLNSATGSDGGGASGCDGASRSDALSSVEEGLPVGPVPRNLPPVTSPQQYQVQFSTSEEHVHLMERAKALMAREHAGVSLGELHFEAMKPMVASLEKRKFAVHALPRQRGAGARPARVRWPSKPDRSEARPFSGAFSRRGKASFWLAAWASPWLLASSAGRASSAALVSLGGDERGAATAPSRVEAPRLATR
jgi:hypothetical protein